MLPVEIDGARYTGCPVAAVDRRLMREALGLYRHYRAGFLPRGGGIYDQQERDLEMIETVAGIMAEIDAEEVEKGKR